MRYHLLLLSLLVASVFCHESFVGHKALLMKTADERIEQEILGSNEKANPDATAGSSESSNKKGNRKEFSLGSTGTSFDLTFVPFPAFEEIVRADADPERSVIRYQRFCVVLKNESVTLANFKLLLEKGVGAVVIATAKTAESKSSGFEDVEGYIAQHEIQQPVYFINEESIPDSIDLSAKTFDKSTNIRASIKTPAKVKPEVVNVVVLLTSILCNCKIWKFIIPTIF